MIWDAIARFVVAIFYLAGMLISSAARFVIFLVGPGLLAAIVAAVALLWWFGILGAVWNAAASLFA